MAKTNVFDTMAAFCDVTCPQFEGVDLEEVDKGIAECQCMLWNAIDNLELNPESKQWKEEVAFWRRILQDSKRNKRRMLALT